MAKKTLPRQGTGTAIEIYTFVGFALTAWELSEDALMGLFSLLCKENEPIAFASYVKAPRSVRSSMLRLCLEVYNHKIGPNESKSIMDSITKLDKLAAVRNEIAHGSVCSLREHIDNQVIADGHYLLPSFNEQGPFEREYRFHHTSTSIQQFEQSVQIERRKILEIINSIRLREQSAENLAGPQVYSQRDAARRIANGQIRPNEIMRYMKPLAEW